MGKSTIRNNIKQLRYEAGQMTQQELAKRVGMTRQTLIAIEGEKYSPSLEVAFRISEVFDKPLESIFQHRPQ